MIDSICKLDSTITFAGRLGSLPDALKSALELCKLIEDLEAAGDSEQLDFSTSAKLLAGYARLRCELPPSLSEFLSGDEISKDASKKFQQILETCCAQEVRTLGGFRARVVSFL